MCTSCSLSHQFACMLCPASSNDPSTKVYFSVALQFNTCDLILDYWTGYAHIGLLYRFFARHVSLQYDGNRCAGSHVPISIHWVLNGNLGSRAHDISIGACGDTYMHGSRRCDSVNGVACSRRTPRACHKTNYANDTCSRRTQRPCHMTFPAIDIIGLLHTQTHKQNSERRLFPRVLQSQLAHVLTAQ